MLRTHWPQAVLYFLWLYFQFCIPKFCLGLKKDFFVAVVVFCRAHKRSLDVLSCVQLFVTPWTREAPLSMGFSRQEYWSRLLFSAPEAYKGPLDQSVQFSLVIQSCLTLCDPMNHSIPGLPVHYQLPEFTQTHVHWVGDAIQPFHPLSSPSPPALNLSQHQGLFQWVNSSHEVAKVLEFQLQRQSFQWTPRTDLLLDGLVGSPCSPRDSQESSPTPQFKSINFSALSFLHSPTLTSVHDHWKNHSLDQMDLCWQSNVSAF